MADGRWRSYPDVLWGPRRSPHQRGGPGGVGRVLKANPALRGELGAAAGQEKRRPPRYSSSSGDRRLDVRLQINFCMGMASGSGLPMGSRGRPRRRASLPPPRLRRHPRWGAPPRRLRPRRQRLLRRPPPPRRRWRQPPRPRRPPRPRWCHHRQSTAGATATPPSDGHARHPRPPAQRPPPPHPAGRGPLRSQPQGRPLPPERRPLRPQQPPPGSVRRRGRYRRATRPSPAELRPTRWCSCMPRQGLSMAPYPASLHRSGHGFSWGAIICPSPYHDAAEYPPAKITCGARGFFLICSRPFPCSSTEVREPWPGEVQVR